MKAKLRLIFVFVIALSNSVRSQSGYGSSPPRTQPVQSNDAKVKPEGQGQPVSPTYWAGQPPRDHRRPNEGGAQESSNTAQANPSPECMLRLKSDCYGGVPSTGSRAIASGQTPSSPSNYQLDGFATYPVYTAYVIPTVGGFGPPPLQQQQSRPLDPSQQNTILYSSVSESEQGAPNFELNQGYPVYQQNYEPLPQPPQQSLPHSPHQSLPQSPQKSLPQLPQQPIPPAAQQSLTPVSQQPQAPRGQLNYNYKPAVVPYKAPPQGHHPTYTNVPQQGSSDRQPNTGGLAEQAIARNILPYPGCPAAMVCVPEDFCDAKGVRVANPVQVSAAEKLYRVALEVCSAPTTGEVGVCCRDPDYKDPWPMNGGQGSGGDREGKGIQYDDGQYRPDGNRQGKTVQYDDGSYRPEVHGGQPQVKGVTTYDEGQYRPHPQAHVPTQTNSGPAHRQPLRQEQPVPYPQYGQKLAPQEQAYPQYQQTSPQQYQPLPPTTSGKTDPAEVDGGAGGLGPGGCRSGY